MIATGHKGGRMLSRTLCTATALAALLATPALAQEEEDSAAPRESRVRVTPYLGVDQVALVPLKGDGDILTYTNVTAGVSAQVQTRRVEASVDAQYTHSFGWGSQLSDQDILTGIAQAQVQVARGLSVQAGGIAARTRTDGLSGAAPQRDSYSSQLWAGSIGPSYTTRIGDLSVNAAYRLGYARVDDDVDIDFPGVQSASRFDESWSHSLSGSVGFAPGTLLPVGLVASAGYDREDASQLDQRFEDAWGRLDATLPLTPTFALVGGIGYEKLEISQRPVLLADDGTAVIRNGNYVADPNAPRTLVYDFDDIIWDAGVLWRPSRRTSLEARIGGRYGSMTYLGNFSWQGRNSSFGVSVFDGIQSFGRLTASGLGGLAGSDLDVVRNPFTGDLVGCAFSVSGGGQCFNDSLAGITGANFRYRGVAAQYGHQVGRWGMGFGAGYSQRKFLTPRGEQVLVRGTRDENWYGSGSVRYAFSSSEALETVGYVNYFDASGDRADVLNYGAYTTYSKGLSRRLRASASVGIDAVKADEIDSVINALGQIGLRYSF